MTAPKMPRGIHERAETPVASASLGPVKATDSKVCLEISTAPHAWHIPGVCTSEFSLEGMYILELIWESGNSLH